MLCFPSLQAYSTPNMDAGGKATAAWCIATFVKLARSPNLFANAATCKSAASPRKWPQQQMDRLMWLVLERIHVWDLFIIMPCADRWVVEEWSPCSKTCGKLGYQTRVVQCMQALHNGTSRPVHSKHCTGDRPETRKACNHTTCPPQWRTGAWSQVRT